MVPTELKLIRVFLSSPSDLSQFREAIRGMVPDFNKLVRGQRLAVEVVGFEDIPSGITAERIQEYINEQIGDYDIFIGLMGARFGTATGPYGSGTEEEFSLAVEGNQQNRSPREVMFYFSDATPEKLSEIDTQELARVNEFRNRVQSRVFTRSFRDISDLITILRLDLFEKMKLFIDPQQASSGGAAELDESIDSVLAGSRAATDRLTELVENVAAKMAGSTVRFNARLAQIHASKDRRMALLLVNRFARDLQDLADLLDISAPSLAKEFDTMCDGFSRGSLLVLAEFPGARPAVDDAKAALRILRTQTTAAADTLANGLPTIDRLPEITPELGRAKRFSQIATRRFLSEMRVGIARLEAIEGFI